MPKKRLTTKGIKALPIPTEGRKDYQDEILPGLFLRVSSTGRKTYSVSYWKNGRRPRVTLGVSRDSPKDTPGTDLPRLSLAEARSKAKDVLEAVRLGLDPAAEKKEEKEAISFEDLAYNYLERHAKQKKVRKGWRSDERRIEKVLLPRWGAWKAGDVRKRDVVKLLDEYEDRDHYRARNRMAALVSVIYSFGLDRDAPGLTGNPASGLQDPELERPRRRVLSDEELEDLLPVFRKEYRAGTKNAPRPGAGLGFRLLLLTAQRPSEIFEAEWSEIQKDKDGEPVLVIPKERRKNRRSKNAPEEHFVPLSPAAMKIITELRTYKDDPGGFLFPSPVHGKPFTNYQKAVERIRKAADLEEEWRVYPDLKTTALTRMKRKLEIPPHVLEAIPGHVPGGVTHRHYAFGTYEKEKRRALNTWGEYVEKLDPSTTAKVIELRRGRTASEGGTA